MSALSMKNFEKSIKNYKKILHGIIIVFLALFAGYPLPRLLFGSNFSTRFIPRLLFGSNLSIYMAFNLINSIFILFSFLLYIFISNKILNQILDQKLKEIYKSFRLLNYISFMFIFVEMSPFFYFSLIKLVVNIILIVQCYTKYSKLKKKELKKILQYDIKLSLMLIEIGMIISLFLMFLLSYNFYIFHFFFSVKIIGPVLIAIGMASMNNKAISYFYLQNSKDLTNSEKFQQFVKQNKFFGEFNENITEQATEIKILKAEFEPDFVKLSEKSTKEDIVEQTSELVMQPEIPTRKEIPQENHETMVLKEETNLELIEKRELMSKVEIAPQRVKTKIGELLNCRINREKVSKKPIQSKIIKEKIPSQVSTKKCPFCGKEHDDFNVTFCHACGFKF